MGEAMKKITIYTMLEQHRMCQLSFVIGLLSCFSAQGQTVSFHGLFPMTWYEKGLNATVSVWHKIGAFIDEKNDDVSHESFDAILGRFVFAYFCLENMFQQKQTVIDEDILYLVKILHSIEERLIKDSTDIASHDRLLCLSRMVEHTKKLLHSPSDF